MTEHNRATTDISTQQICATRLSGLRMVLAMEGVFFLAAIYLLSYTLYVVFATSSSRNVPYVSLTEAWRQWRIHSLLPSQAILWGWSVSSWGLIGIALLSMSASSLVLGLLGRHNRASGCRLLMSWTRSAWNGWRGLIAAQWENNSTAIWCVLYFAGFMLVIFLFEWLRLPDWCWLFLIPIALVAIQAEIIAIIVLFVAPFYIIGDFLFLCVVVCVSMMGIDMKLWQHVRARLICSVACGLIGLQFSVLAYWEP